MSFYENHTDDWKTPLHENVAVRKKIACFSATQKTLHYSFQQGQCFRIVLMGFQFELRNGTIQLTKLLVKRTDHCLKSTVFDYDMPDAQNNEELEELSRSKPS